VEKNTDAMILLLAKLAGGSPGIRQKGSTNETSLNQLFPRVDFFVSTVRSDRASSSTNIEDRHLDQEFHRVSHSVGYAASDIGRKHHRILSLEDKEISRVLVNNSSLVNAIAISSNQIQLSALKPGITQLNP